MTQSDRGIHPDLLEETLAEREAPAVEQNGGGRARRSRSMSSPRTAAPSVPPVSNGVPEDGGGEGVSAQSPSPESGDEQPSETAVDWRSAQSDEEAFRLLAKKLPSDVLQKDETLSGLIGSRADLRARDILRQQQRDADEQRKREAAANNDLYTLGELTQREYQQQAQQSGQADQLMPLMNVIARVQQTLPEAIQKEIAGKSYGEGKSWDDGAVEYVSDVIDRLTKHRLSERESALRKSILSEVNGSEPVPEREGGTPSRVRVVTDEQVAAMSLAEYDALFDENGHPRPGVRHQATRGIPIQRQ